MSAIPTKKIKLAHSSGNTLYSFDHCIDVYELNNFSTQYEFRSYRKGGQNDSITIIWDKLSPELWVNQDYIKHVKQENISINDERLNNSPCIEVLVRLIVKEWVISADKHYNEVLKAIEHSKK